MEILLIEAQLWLEKAQARDVVFDGGIVLANSFYNECIMLR